MHFYGIAIVSKESKNIWKGTVFSFFMTMIIAIFIFFMRYDGYLIGVLSFTIATFLETFFIAYLVRKQLWDYKSKIYQKDLKMIFLFIRMQLYKYAVLLQTLNSILQDF